MLKTYGILLVIFLSFKKQWKHIFVGFFYEKSDRTKSLNLLITYVAYRIYKQIMLCRLDSMNETEYNIYNHVKKSTFFYASVLRVLNANADCKFFQNLLKMM